MYSSDARALSDVQAVHGPRDILARYFALADAAARDRGVEFKIRTDFDRLLEVREQNADNFPPVSPIFNSRYSVLTPDSAFWVEGVDAAGQTVATSAARVCDHGRGSLADDLRSLRIFYERPGVHLAAGESIEVLAPAAEKMRGRTMASGVVWVRPDHRRHGFTRIIPRLARSHALSRWNTRLFWGLVTQELDNLGVTAAYGSWQMSGRLGFHMPSWLGDIEGIFLWMDSEALIGDIEKSCNQATTDNSRRIDTDMTNTSPRSYQGISTRS